MSLQIGNEIIYLGKIGYSTTILNSESSQENKIDCKIFTFTTM